MLLRPQNAMKEGDKGEKLMFEWSLNSGMTRVGYARE